MTIPLVNSFFSSAVWGTRRGAWRSFALPEEGQDSFATVSQHTFYLTAASGMDWITLAVFSCRTCWPEPRRLYITLWKEWGSVASSSVHQWVWQGEFCSLPVLARFPFLPWCNAVVSHPQPVSHAETLSGDTLACPGLTDSACFVIPLYGVVEGQYCSQPCFESWLKS